MEKKKTFIMGMAAGMAAMMLLIFALAPIRAQIIWSGLLPPEAKILEIYSLLSEHSIVPVDKAVLLDNMYRGLLEGVGDRYTYYFDRESFAVFRERTAGVFTGIGMQVILDPEDNLTTVVNVFSGTPAEEAGLLPGDKILAVDRADVTGKRLEEVIALIKGEVGTQVQLRILRGEDRFSLDITRQRIQVPTVSHKMLENNIGYLHISGFEGVTYEQFEAAYLDLRRQGLQGLIIDLRNNGGGLLCSVIDISNLVLPRGVVLYVENNRGERTAHMSDDDMHMALPLVMLVNNGSASASEVLTGAVRDHGVGTVVGQQTFGKGVVQHMLPLTDGSAIKVTVARYYTPSGISIHEEGITPDFIVEVDRETAMQSARLTLEEDIQLQKAIEVMKNKMD